MSCCTWKSCEDEGVHAQIAADRSVWASLCPKHDAELLAAVRSGKPPQLMRAWVLAQGGAEAAAKRVFP